MVSLLLAAERVLSPRLVSNDTCADAEHASAATTVSKIAVLRTVESETSLKLESIRVALAALA
jgi:hypothetical protein